MTGIDEMIDNSDNLVTEIMALAKKTSAGHRRVMRKYKDIQYTLKRSKRKWIYTNQRTSFIPTIPKRSGTRWTK